VQASLFSVSMTARHLLPYGPHHLNFRQNISTASVFLNIEKVFDKTWHLGLLYKLWDLNFSIRLIKLITCFLSHRKFRVSVESEMSKLRDIQAGVPQCSIISPTLDSMYRNGTPQTPGFCLGLFADVTCIYATDRTEGCVLSESYSEVSVLLRHGVSA
jgi:hypothetical protein